MLKFLTLPSRIVRATFYLTAIVALSLPAWAQKYEVTITTSDIPSISAFTDANLNNPWGLSISPAGAWWVSDNGTGLSTLYDGTGKPQSLVVTIPSANHSDTGTPSGTVFNGTQDFQLAAGKPALFLFVTEDGTMSGWNPGVDGVNALITVDNSGSNAIYKGMAIGSAGGANYLYATNFHAGTVEVYDKNFAPHSFGANAFKDDTIPAGFAPFNIQAIGSNLVVTYAKQDDDGEDDVPGPGNGYVDIYDMQGNLLTRLPHLVYMNSPWAVVQAPANFGTFSNDLLIGNFGSGSIMAFNPNTGSFIGLVFDPAALNLRINGLWALAFGNGGQGGPKNTLYFTAGVFGEAHGLFGTILPATGGGSVHGSSKSKTK